jgi:hypothetical protein
MAGSLASIPDTRVPNHSGDIRTAAAAIHEGRAARRASSSSTPRSINDRYDWLGGRRQNATSGLNSLR